jgi:hypothetical protein
MKASAEPDEAAYSGVVTSAAGRPVPLLCLAGIICQNIRQNTGHSGLHALT